MRSLVATFTSVSVFGLCLIAGCSSKPSNIAPVSGIITHKGKPIEGARLSFQPDTGELVSGPGSYGKTDAMGRYSLKLIEKEERPGAIIGPHKVTIIMPGSGKFDPRDDNIRETPKTKTFDYMVTAEGTGVANFEVGP